MFFTPKWIKLVFVFCMMWIFPYSIQFQQRDYVATVRHNLNYFFADISYKICTHTLFGKEPIFTSQDLVDRNGRSLQMTWVAGLKQQDIHQLLSETNILCTKPEPETKQTLVIYEKLE